MSDPKKVSPKTLDMSQLKKKERDAVQSAVSAPGSSKGSQKGMLDGQKRLELYKHIDIIVKICIDAAMKAAKGGSEDGRMNVDFGTMTYIITARALS